MIMMILISLKYDNRRGFHICHIFVKQLALEKLFFARVMCTTYVYVRTQHHRGNCRQITVANLRSCIGELSVAGERMFETACGQCVGAARTRQQQVGAAAASAALQCTRLQAAAEREDPCDRTHPARTELPGDALVHADRRTGVYLPFTRQLKIERAQGK